MRLASVLPDSDSSLAETSRVLAAIGSGFSLPTNPPPNWYQHGHFVEQKFGERFNVPPAACSSVLMWRILHRDEREGCTDGKDTLGMVGELLQAEAVQRGLDDGTLVQLETRLPTSVATLVHAHCARTAEVPTDYLDLVAAGERAFRSFFLVFLFFPSVFDFVLR
jgi:hypothetical protein